MPLAHPPWFLINCHTGEDVESILWKLLVAAGHDVELAQRSVCFIGTCWIV